MPMFGALKRKKKNINKRYYVCIYIYINTYTYMNAYVGRRHKDWPLNQPVVWLFYLHANMKRLGTWRHVFTKKHCPAFFRFLLYSTR